MNRIHSAALLFCAGLLASPAGARTWTNTEGDTLEAEFVRLRDRTVILKTDDETIRAPLAKLSEADREWVDRHKQMTRSRVWGDPSGAPYRGKFLSVRNGKVRVQQGSQVAMVPFGELVAGDWAYLEALHEHLETALPEELAAAKPSARTPTPPATEGPTREWVDVTGRKITATLVGSRDGKPLLRMRGREFAVPLGRLSKADRAWLAEFQLARLVDDLRAGASDAATVFTAAASGGASVRSVPPPPTVVPSPDAP